MTAGTETIPGEGVSAVGETHDGPFMPHRLYGEEELARRYPPPEAVAEAEGDEQLGDALLERGIETAGQIVADTVSFGRRRVQKSSGEPKPLREKEDLGSPG